MGQWNYQMRVALPFGTLVLGPFLARGRRPFLEGPARCDHGRRRGLSSPHVPEYATLTLDGAPPAVAAWLANAVFMGATA